MRVHISDSCKSLKWLPYEYDWSEFVLGRLVNPLRTNETFEIYQTLDADEKKIYKDCGGYIFGTLQNNSRSKKDVISRGALLLDLDFAPYNLWREITETFVNTEIVLHSTHSHCYSSPRYRLIVPLSRECTPEEYECVGRTFAQILNMEYFDPTTFQRNRLMYFPSVSSDGEYVFEWQKGQFFDVDNILSLYSDWRDMRTWFYHSMERNVHSGTGKDRQDPKTLEGIIGSFNRCFSIEDAIQRFLPDVYMSGEGGRYTYIKGSSALGAVTYNGVWFYSHHSTDPAQGRLLSAFELCMCHLHDDDLTRAIAWADTLDEVRTESMMGIFSAITNKTEPSKISWVSRLELDKQRKIVQNDINARLIFENDENLKGAFMHNDFINNTFVMRNLPWRNDVPKNGQSIINMDYICLRTYLGQYYGFTNRPMIDETMKTISFEKRYHPIRDYLCSLKWDGEPRIETALIDYFGVDDSIYTREAFKKALIGAIMRVFNPGCKHDTLVVLVGTEGTAKSEFIKRLGVNWFSNTFDMKGEKSIYEQLLGKWIIEIGEIDRLSRVAVGEVKNFVQQRVDTFRPAYGKVPEDFPRQNIFFGTTNKRDFLKSENGNRRFHPMLVNNGMYERNQWKSKKYVFFHMTPEEVSQMWAEAFHYFCDGETNVLSKEATREADRLIGEFEETDVLTGEIDHIITQKVPENYDDLSISEAQGFWLNPELSSNNTKSIEWVSAIELWTVILGHPRFSYDKLKSLEVLSSIRKSSNIDINDIKFIYSKRFGKQKHFKVKQQW